MTSIPPSLPPFALWSGADEATRRALLIAHRTTEASKHLIAIDRAHIRLVPILTDLSADLAADYLIKTLEFRKYFPEMVAEIQSLHRFSAPEVERFLDQKLREQKQFGGDALPTLGKPDTAPDQS